MNVEILAPGGSIEGMRAAIAAGADAVYMGGTMFGARAYADNPEETDLLQAIDYCHLLGKKLYLTVNTLLKQQELETKLYDFMLPLYEQGLDAVLVQDMGVLQFLKREFPDLPLHGSTQLSIQSPDGARLLKRMGAERIVPARELSLREINDIHTQPDLQDLEIECFVHGAMCYCYSGQCLMSSLIGGRSGNRGRCAQPCRQQYGLTENERELRHRDGRYLLSLKDTCTLETLPDLMDAGVCSFKIEGRMKHPTYAAGVSAVYRHYADLYLSKGREGYRVDPDDVRYLMDLFNRGGFSGGYYRTENGPKMIAAARPNHIGTEAGKVQSVKGGKVRMKSLEPLRAGDLLQLSSPYTLTEDASEGDLLNISAWKGAQSGQIVRRIRSVEAAERSEGAAKQKSSVKIKGNFKMQRNASAILTVSNGTETVTVEGEIPQIAVNRSTAEADIEKALRKTGGTVYTWETLAIEAEDGLFYPLTKLNELRRAALEQLSARITGTYRRAAAGAVAHEQAAEGERRADCKASAVREKAVCFVKEEEQLLPVLQEQFIDEIIMDSLLWLDGAMSISLRDCVAKIHETGKRFVLAMPPIWRLKARERWAACFTPEDLQAADGLLLRCLDQLPAAAAVKKKNDGSFTLSADYNLYTWNKRAENFFLEQGMDELTLPLELNARELADRTDEHDCRVLYGRSPMMYTAQCLMKTTEGCRHEDALLTLTDKTGAAFPVHTHCGVCMNIIYNSVPLDLTGLYAKGTVAKTGAVRIDLTTENQADTAELMKRLHAILENRRAGRNREEAVTTGGIAAGASTRGHYKRGVE